MEKFNVLIQAYQHLKIHIETLCCIIMKFLTANVNNVNTQTSRDPSRAAPIRPEFELGIFTSSCDLFMSLNSEIY